VGIFGNLSDVLISYLFIMLLRLCKVMEKSFHRLTVILRSGCIKDSRSSDLRDEEGVAV